jgi:hypothetical protein
LGRRITAEKKAKTQKESLKWAAQYHGSYVKVDASYRGLYLQMAKGYNIPAGDLLCFAMADVTASGYGCVRIQAIELGAPWSLKTIYWDSFSPKPKAVITRVENPEAELVMAKLRHRLNEEDPNKLTEAHKEKLRPYLTYWEWKRRGVEQPLQMEFEEEQE